MRSLGNCKGKGRPAARLGFDPDAPAMPLDDSFANGQPDARARILPAAVQTLEDDEYALEVMSFDADALVPHGEAPGFRFGCSEVGVARGIEGPDRIHLLGRNVDDRGLVAAELDCVA